MIHYYKIAFVCFAACLLSVPAMGKGNESCGGPKSTPAETRDCLARMSDPARVRERHEQEKRDRCEQSAKNRNLQGNAKANYLSSCMHENQAAAAQASVNDRRPVSTPRARQGKGAATSRGKRTSGNSCVTQANKEHMKGSKRRQFLKTCKPH